jgi:serine/threonine protein phosphatase PrpC/predicted Ser/Thr protein kinase
MSPQPQVAIGQASDKGRKPVNQDFHGVILPTEPLLSSKGIAAAIADGISSSEVSQHASETAVKSFLEDYYATSEAWSVKTSVQRVLHAANSWLYAATRNGPYRYDIEKGFVCTFSAVVLKSATAHIFHAGDTRIYRLLGNSLEQLTEDHRQWLSREQSYLSRALGMRERVEIDYSTHAVEAGDTFILATDGVYEFVEASDFADLIRRHHRDLDQAARLVVDQALQRGSTDNLTVQIVRVDQIPHHTVEEVHQQAALLPFPPELRPRMEIDGYRIARELHYSARSHVYLAVDGASGREVVLKIPSVDLRQEENYLESFLMEEWVARRIDNVHLLKAYPQERKRNYLYSVSEYVEGQTLTQWMNDNPRPDLETVRDIVEQISRGLQAMHRQEMLHRDLRPNNVMIDTNGTVRIIDFGAVRVAGVAEIGELPGRQYIPGTMQYTAPEYFLGEAGTTRSDLFSLGVITYQMLSGRLPYGPGVARARSRAAQRRLSYQTVLDSERTIPVWVDAAIRKAVHHNPLRRYEELSEFLYDLRHPNPALTRSERAPLLERNPLLFWKALSLLLFTILLILLATHPVTGTH